MAEVVVSEAAEEVVMVALDGEEEAALDEGLEVLLDVVTLGEVRVGLLLLSGHLASMVHDNFDLGYNRKTATGPPNAILKE